MATFTGTSSVDVANAGSGTLTGFTGGTLAELQDGIGDTFSGGAGNDTVNAGSGNDTINGGADNDLLIGNAGDDTINGGSGLDTINGGVGFDDVRYDFDATAGGSAGVTVNLSTGVAVDGFGNTDSLIFGTIEAVRGTAQADSLTGSNRTDESEQFTGLAGNDAINGLGGFDEVRYDRDANAGGGAAVSVNSRRGWRSMALGILIR